MIFYLSKAKSCKGASSLRLPGKLGKPLLKMHENNSKIRYTPAARIMAHRMIINICMTRGPAPKKEAAAGSASRTIMIAATKKMM